MVIAVHFVFFFFKQKTAYEMRISDWSSDVCSSDLDNGEEPFHQHAGDEQVMPHRVAAVAIFAGIVERVLLALLLGYLDAFGRRAEPSEQGEHRQRHDREQGDLAIGIEGPEIEEDDVDDVGAATARISVLDERARQAVRRVAGDRKSTRLNSSH